MSEQQKATSLPFTRIPSVAAMKQRFNDRIKPYLDQMTAYTGSSREGTTELLEEPDSMPPKRKQRRSATSKTGKEEEEEDNEEEEQAEPPQEEGTKFTIKINFTYNSITVNTAPPSQTAQQVPTKPKTRKRRRSHHNQDKTGEEEEEEERGHHRTRSLRPGTAPNPPPPSSITTTANNNNNNNNKRRHRRNNRSNPTQTTQSIPYYPFLRVENEPKEPWDLIPLPSSSLPGDTEGAKSAWTRLFPHLEPLGEYGGCPTGWMARMCWKEGQWRERGPGEPYVERFLGKVDRGMLGVERGRQWRG